MTRKPTEMEMMVAVGISIAYERRIDKRRVIPILESTPEERGVALAKYWIEESRAAIQAMRYPTREMMDAGDNEMRIGLPDAWLAMIDSASPPIG